MPKRTRLTRHDLTRLTPKRRIHGRFFSVSYAPLSKGARFTCVVSKKVSPKAVVRNAIKRRCREALRKEAKALTAGAYVCIAKREAAQALSRDITEDISVLAQKLRDIS